jgi:aryl-alcohol dehydrogenase-like predicted oxidoreductase
MKMALGTVQFGLDYGISNPKGKTPAASVTEILQFAYSKGVDRLDTASTYGSSEDVIGSYLDSHGEERWKVVSKAPKMKNVENVEADFGKYFRRSKAKLANSLDTYMAHDAVQFLENPVIQSKFHALKEQGLVNKIGVSVYSEQEINGLLRIGGLDVIQLPLSVLDHRLINDGTLARIKDYGIEIHARSVFLQGLLFLSQEELKKRFPSVVKPMSILLKIAGANGLELSELALLFVDRLPEVDVLIVGVDNLLQLSANIDAIGKQYGADISKEILSSINYCDASVLNPSQWKN